MFTQPSISDARSQSLLECRTVTGRHDAHFLQRTDRLRPAQAEFALALYRDYELVRTLLGQLRVSESVERVAISLNHPTFGPFIVVARNGHFVTCLGEGMRTKNIPVVTKSEFDQVSRRVQRVRNIMHDVALHPAREVKRALNRLFKDGPDLSREEFCALAAWQPLLAPSFLRLFMKLWEQVAGTYEILAPRQRAFKRRDEPALRVYYEQCWALAHLAMLLGADGGEYLRSLSDEPFFPELTFALTHTLSCLNVTSLAIRGAWLASRIGKPLVASLKDEYLSSPSLLRTIAAGLALSAVGHTHRRLQGEIGKVLQSEPCAKHPRVAELSQLQPIFASQYRAGLLAPDGSSVPVTDVAGQFAPLLRAPDPVISGDFAKLKELLTQLPILARAKAEDFYMPRRNLERTRSTPSLSSAIQLIEPLRQYHRFTGALLRLRPRVRSERVPRNSECPCGSQKKFKHCCMRAAPTLH